MRNTSVFTLIAAAAISLVAVVVQPTAASALTEPCHTTVVKTSMTPTTGVVGVTQVKSSTYTVVLDNNCDNPGLFVSLASTTDVVGVGVSMDPPTNNGKGQYTFTGSTSWDPATMNNAQYAGSWISVIDVFSDNGPSLSSPGVDFRILRAASLTTKTSTVAAKGSSIYVSGSLRRASWDTKSYDRLGGQLVDLQFKTSTGAYSTVKTTRSMSNGSVLKSVVANVDGCYRYVYRGNATTSAIQSVPTCVDVR